MSNKCPAWLPEQGKKLWKELAPTLDLDASRSHVLAMLCDHYAQFREASEKLKQDGVVVPTASGSVREHPCVGIQFKASFQIQKLMQLLGLVVKGKTTTEGVDALDKFLEE